MVRIALRGVREHLVRFLLSVLAVTLGVAFVAGTFSLRQMLSATFSDIVATSNRADAYVRAPEATEALSGSGSTSTGLPLSLVTTLTGVPGVAAAVPALQGPVVLVGADGTAVRSFQAPSYAIGWDVDDPTAAALTGHAPTAADQIVVERHALDRSGLEIGDSTRIVLGGSVRAVTVVGSVDWGPATAGATLVFLDPQTARTVLAPDGTVTRIAVYADRSAHLTPQQLVARIAATAKAAGGEAVTATTVRDEAAATITHTLGFVSTFLLMFAALALFVGAFIIANTFAMTVRQRLRELALLRAVGASPTQVFVSVALQAAVVGVIGSVLGVAGGVALVEALRVVLGRMGMTLSGSVPLTAGTVAVSVAIGTVVSVVASVLPARRAALVSPVEAMRDELVATDRSIVGRAVAGGVLTVAGAGAVWWTHQHPTLAHAGAVLGLGAAAVLVGVLAAGPALAPAAVRVLAVPFVAAVRPLGRLARGNVTRNPRRTANTAGALTIGMTLVGAAAVIAASTQASVSSLVATETHADLVLRTDEPQTLPADLLTAVRAQPGVAAAYGFPYASAPAATGRTPTATDAVWFSGADPAALGTVLVPQEESTDPAPALARGEAVVDSQLAEAKGWHVGDTLTVVGLSSTRRLVIGGTIRSDLLGRWVLVSATTLDALVPAAQQRDITAFVVVTPGADVATVHDRLVDQAKPYLVVSVLTAGEFGSTLSAQVRRVLVILYALLGLSVLIAGLGIVNTLALSVIERTREIGLLRAIGLGRLQLAGTVTIESVLTALSGTLLGLAIGVGLASALPGVFVDQGLSTLAVPWRSLVTMLVLAVALGVVAAVWPGVRAARLRVLDAIGSE